MRNLRRFLRGTRASVIVEFALVVPLFFILLAGIIAFSQAYGRLNALTSSIREGARAGSALPPTMLVRDSVTKRVRTFSAAYGYTVDTSRVTVTFGNDVTVGVTNYPLFTGITALWGLSAVQVTRSAIFRWEYAT